MNHRDINEPWNKPSHNHECVDVPIRIVIIIMMMIKVLGFAWLRAPWIFSTRLSPSSSYTSIQVNELIIIWITRSRCNMIQTAFHLPLPRYQVIGFSLCRLKAWDSPHYHHQGQLITQSARNSDKERLCVKRLRRRQIMIIVKDRSCVLDLSSSFPSCCWFVSRLFSITWVKFHCVCFRHLLFIIHSFNQIDSYP